MLCFEITLVFARHSVRTAPCQIFVGGEETGQPFIQTLDSSSYVYVYLYLSIAIFSQWLCIENCATYRGESDPCPSRPTGCPRPTFLTEGNEHSKSTNERGRLQVMITIKETRQGGHLITRVIGYDKNCNGDKTGRPFNKQQRSLRYILKPRWKSRT